LYARSPGYCKAGSDFNPALLNSKGPQGFTMLDAQKSGNEAAVVEYLQSIGDKETRMDFYAHA
jgi:hypothetical protein